jgi:hypothetical protein
MPLLTMLSSFGPHHVRSATPPFNTVLPSISGTASAGQVLTCSTGTWTGAAPITYAYQWYRNSSLISGETASTYTVLSSDVGASLTCTVTATNALGAVSATSAGVSVNPLIPAGAIIMYNGTDPGLSGWTRYTAADGLYIKGTATQGEIATTTAAAISSWSISASVGTAGSHSASSGWVYTSSINAGSISVGPQATAGAHSGHSLTFSSSSTAARPYSTGMLLLKATSDQTTFPTNTIHINDSNRGASWTQKVAATDFRYIKGDASTPTDYANVSVAVSTTSGNDGYHTHVGSSLYSSSSPAPNTYNPSSSTGQNHAHSVSSTVDVSRIPGKIHKMWIAASSDAAYTNTIVMFDGTLSSLPSYWKVCNGTAGTVDMTTYFLGYSNSSGTAHNTTTTTTSAFAPTTTNSAWTHTHGTTINTGTTTYVRTTGHQSSSYSHTHSVTGSATVTGYDPGSIKLAFIQYIP